MTSELTNRNGSVFDAIRNTSKEGFEYWSAREMAKQLDYSDYRNFLKVIEKAKTACENSGHSVVNHFVDITDMVEIGSGARRRVDDVRLSRYACYLIVQNSDPSKEIVALGQTYFAVQTRKQELMESADYSSLGTEDEKRLFLRREMRAHNRKLADAAKKAGVIRAREYAIFQNHGYRGLYGGLVQEDIHARKGLKKGEKILDHMGSTELAANLFRATQTEEKLKRDNVRTKTKANRTHYEVGKKVRQTIRELGGTMPEELPAPESIKKIERKKKTANVIAKTTEGE